MSLVITCPNAACHSKFERPLSDSGKIIACPRCEAPVILPRSEGGLAGQTIGGYRLVRHIARGGMGEVYEALQIKLNRRVALKVLAGELAGNDSFVQRFEREARSAAAVNHPNLVQVYDFDQADGRAFLAMEFVDGEDLSKRVAREGKLPVSAALRVVEDVARALQEANTHGIIHRDVKPGNILVNSRGQIKVSDLGLALNVEDNLDLTATGIVIGSPHFMAPEQAHNPHGVDLRADIYSLGITLLFLLTGRRPYEGASVYAVVSQHSHDPLPTGAALGTELSENVETLVQRMAAKRPENRYQDYASLIADLRRVRAGQMPLAAMPSTPGDATLVPGDSVSDTFSFSSSALPPAPATPPRVEQAPRSSRKILWLAGGVSLCLAGLVTALVIHFRPPARGVSPKDSPEAITDDSRPRPPGEEKGRDDFRPPPGPGGPPSPLRPLDDIINPLPVTATTEQMWEQTKAYAKTNASDFRGIFARLMQTRARAQGTALAKAVSAFTGEQELLHKAAAEREMMNFTEQMNRAIPTDGPHCVRYWREFPDGLRTPEIDRRITDLVEATVHRIERTGGMPKGNKGQFDPTKGPPPDGKGPPGGFDGGKRPPPKE